MMEIMEIPWYCDDKDCSQTFHLALYTIDDITGEQIHDPYGDGDWEVLDENDWPSEAERLEGWRAYYDHCRTFGEDPLHQIKSDMPYPDKVTEKWEALFSAAEKNVAVSNIKSCDRPWTPEIPKEVKEYLCLEEEGPGGTWISTAFESIQEMAEGFVGNDNGSDVFEKDGETIKVTCDIELEVEPPKEISAAFIKDLAEKEYNSIEEQLNALYSEESAFSVSPRC